MLEATQTALLSARVCGDVTSSVCPIRSVLLVAQVHTAANSKMLKSHLLQSRVSTVFGSSSVAGLRTTSADLNQQECGRPLVRS